MCFQPLLMVIGAVGPHGHLALQRVEADSERGPAVAHNHNQNMGDDHAKEKQAT